VNISSLIKIIHTIRFLKPKQLYWFAFYRTRKILPVCLWLRRRNLPDLQIDKKQLTKYAKYAQTWASVDENLASKARDILAGRWEYAGEQISLSTLSVEMNKNTSPLAMYGLHSFEFLWLLCLAHIQNSDNRYSVFAKECILQWIKKYPLGTAIAWDPYPTSYRIRYWILAMHLWQWNDEEILNSLAVQTKYLSKSLEYHLEANHLIQNLCGLIVSSATLFPSELTGLLQQLETELQEQILEDGGHYERSPMYHLHVFLDLLTVLAILREPPEFLKETLSKMVNFLENMTLSDGDIPLFGDTVHGHLPSFEKVLRVAEKYIPAKKQKTLHSGALSFPSSGYYIYKNNSNPRFEMVIRAGEAGPSFQLAHAHCDQLSYEFLMDNQRVIVDSGMHGYGCSPFRSFQRSTRAHNTVYIEGEEQLECWSTFRVARRGKHLWTLWKPYKEGQLFGGKYQYFNGTIHYRALLILPQEGLLCWDWVKTHHQKMLYNLLHLHPSVEVRIINSFVFLKCDKIKISLYPIQNEMIEIVAGSYSPQQGWYSEFFGTADPNPVIVLKKTSAKNTLTQSGYWISFYDDETKYPKGTIQQWVEEIGNEILNRP